MRKLLAMLLTFAMLFSLATPAVATEPTVTGNQSGNVTATFDPDIAISGISFSGDTVTYDADTGNYVMLIPADLPDGAYARFYYVFEGTNLQYVPEYDEPAQSDLWVRVVYSRSYSEEVTFSEFVAAYVKEYIDGNLLVPNGVDSSAAGMTLSASYSNNNSDGSGTWSEPVSLAFKLGYSVTAGETVNGTVTVPEYAAEGDTVTVAVTPDDGYRLEILTASYEDADSQIVELDVTDNQFVMPAYPVTLTATFAESPEALWGTDADNLTESGTLAEAIAAATAADSTVGYIQLQTDVTADDGCFIRSGVFTLDLNGKTLSSAHHTFNVYYSGTVVTLTDTATGGVVNTTDAGCMAVVAASGGKIVIAGGSYSGDVAVWANDGGIVEIIDGTFTGTVNEAVNVGNSSTLNIIGGNFSGLQAAVAIGSTATITGGTFAAGELGHIVYWTGTLDLSGYDAVDGLALIQLTGANLTVSDENIKLPEGYVFQDSAGNPVTTLVNGTTHTIAADSGVPIYSIQIDTVGTGTITLDKASAAEGESVTVTFTPDPGYVLFDSNAYSSSDAFITVELTPGTDANTYTFTMPAHDVQIVGNFSKGGKAREDLYFNNGGNNDWTNIQAAFYTDTERYIGTVNLVMAENGVYTLPEGEEIPELAYRVYFGGNMGGAAVVEIPTGDENMFTLGTATNEYGQYDGSWSVYTPSQPPADTASVGITWGSLSFTYTDGENGAEGAWSCEDGANEITVTNTGDNPFNAQPIYTAKDGYTEINGIFYESMEAATGTTFVDLYSGESFTFYLKLFNQPSKALDGDTIATVTIRINEGIGQ